MRPVVPANCAKPEETANPGGTLPPTSCGRLWATKVRRPHPGRLTAVTVPVLAALSGCDAAPEIGEARYAVNEPGPWNIPPETLARGEEQFVPYTGAGPWVGESGCADGLTEGAQVLRDFIYDEFSQADHIGGFSCRAIVGDSSTMSVHATGRALDIMIPTIGGEADNGLGDPIGNWLIENAEDIGIQYIIWDEWTWRADRASPKDRAYGGAHPHHDHLHVELSVEAANLETPFFGEPSEPPPDGSCETIESAGATVENAGACAEFVGSSEDWRAADGLGHSGSLLWTNALEADEPAAWARWNLDFDEAGRYRAEVYLAPEYAEVETVRYEIVRGGGVDEVIVDQSAAHVEGWYTIGDFEFAAGDGQHVSLFDNVSDPAAAGQRIAFDALRLTPLAPASGSPDDDAPAEPPDPPASDPGADITGGCAAAPGAGGGLLSPVLLTWLALRLKRRA